MEASMSMRRRFQRGLSSTSMGSISSVDSAPVGPTQTDRGEEAEKRLAAAANASISAPRTGLGLDREQMMENIRKSVMIEEYRVEDFYYTEGVFQRIARSNIFDRATLTIIALNALWIWADTDLNKAPVFTESLPPFQIIEHTFCVYFSLEWTVRFMSFQRKLHCLQDRWFVFDSILVFFMVMETWVMTAVILLAGRSGGGMGNASILRMARLLRLSRMARMVRLFRAMPELLILVKGIAAATRSVCFTLILLVMLLYVFAIALRQLTDSTEVGREYFDTVLGAMYTLLIDGCFMDNLGEVVRKVGDTSPICAAIFWFFVLLSSLTVMNMLIGVLCEVVSAVASAEKETMMVNFVKERMKPLFEYLDQSGDGQISKSEFLSILEKPEAMKLLSEVGIDPIFLLEQSDTIFEEDTDEAIMAMKTEVAPQERSLGFDKLMRVILELRGSNKATVKHIVELRKHVLAAITRANNTLEQIESRFEESQKELAASIRRVSKSSTVVQQQACQVSGDLKAAAQPVFADMPDVATAPLMSSRLDEDAWVMPKEETLSVHDKAFFQPPELMKPFWAGNDLREAASRHALGASSLTKFQQILGERINLSDTSGVGLDTLVRRLEHVAHDALCQVHEDMLKGITTAVDDMARKALVETDDGASEKSFTGGEVAGNIAASVGSPLLGRPPPTFVWSVGGNSPVAPPASQAFEQAKVSIGESQQPPPPPPPPPQLQRPWPPSPLSFPNARAHEVGQA